MIHKALYLASVIILASCSFKHASKTGDRFVCDSIKPQPVYQGLRINQSELKNKSVVFTLESGGESFFARAWLWQNAQKTIDIQHYIFKKDKTGRLACYYLLQAANRGVKIRLLLDEVAVKRGADDMAILDAHENIEVKIYNPGFIYSKSLAHRLVKLLTQMKRLTMRMHVKTITVDQQVSIMGGRNVADEYFDYSHRYNFRDRDIVMLGAPASVVTQSFDVYWRDTMSIPLTKLVKQKKKFHDKKHADVLREFGCDTKNLAPEVKNKIHNFPHMLDTVKSKQLVWVDHVSFVSDEPGKNETRPGRVGGMCTDSMMKLLSEAKSSVIIQSPYIIFNKKERELFKELLDKGVKIKVLTNSMASTDNFEAFSGYKRDRKMILDMGIDIYEFKPSPNEKYSIMIPDEQEKIKYKAVLGLHSKTMIIDGRVAVVGTYNLDPRSADLNTECVAIVRSKEFADNIMKYVDLEFQSENSWHVTKDFNPDKKAGWRKRLKVASRRPVPKDFL